MAHRQFARRDEFTYTRFHRRPPRCRWRHRLRLYDPRQAVAERSIGRLKCDDSEGLIPISAELGVIATERKRNARNKAEPL